MSSLPLIIIFERHWDVVPKSCIKKLLPHLAKFSYDTLCYEFPQNETAEEIIKNVNSRIQQITQLNNQVETRCNVQGLSQQDFTPICTIVSQAFPRLPRERCAKIARSIKNLPAFKIQQETIDMALSKLKFSLKGIDLDLKEGSPIVAASFQGREALNAAIQQAEQRRITTMSTNLVKLVPKVKGVVVGCGIFHASRLLAALAQSGINTPILYYFIHSQCSYTKGVDDIKAFFMNDAVQKDVLKGHTFCLAENQIDDFVTTIVAQIQEKISARQELNGNSSRLEHSSVVLRPTETTSLKNSAVQASTPSLHTNKVSTVVVVIFLLMSCWAASYLRYPNSFE